MELYEKRALRHIHACGARWKPLETDEIAKKYYGDDLLKEGDETLALYYITNGGDGIVLTRHLRSIGAYFAAMHEVGHLSCNHPDEMAAELLARGESAIRWSGYRPMGLVRREIEAWNWALENSEFRISSRLCRCAAGHFCTYLEALQKNEGLLFDISLLNKRIRKYVPRHLCLSD